MWNWSHDGSRSLAAFDSESDLAVTFRRICRHEYWNQPVASPHSCGVRTGEADGFETAERKSKKRITMKKMLLITLGLSLSGLLAQAAEGEAKPAPPPSRAEIIKKYDKNGDGKLDEEERAALQKERQQETLKKYDKNGDGKIDETERQALMEDRKKQRDEALAKRQAEQQKKDEKKEEKK